MGLLIELIKLNIVPLIGMAIYGFMIIGLTILGGRLLQWAGLIRFNSEDSGQSSLAKAVVIAVLAISFALIIAVNTYRPVPEVVLADSVKRASGGCGSKGSTSGGEAKKAGENPVSSNPCGN